MSAVRLDTVKLGWLQSFIVLAECGRQADAAVRLGRKQSQISDGIKSLEKWLGKHLLRPTNRNSLTSDGEVFLAVAQEVVSLALAIRTAAAPARSSLSLSWLQAFLKVVEFENHSEAARQLGLSQPSVSRYIKNLEEWLGKPLFMGLVPPVITNDGREFVPIGGRIINLLEASRTPEAASRPTVPTRVHKKSAEVAAYDSYALMRSYLEKGMEMNPKEKAAIEVYERLDTMYRKKYNRINKVR